MDDMNGAAPAAAEATAAPEATVDAPVSTPNPVHSEPAAEPAKQEVPAKATSIDEALDRATKKVEADTKTDKPAEKASEKPAAKADADKTEPAKADKPRDETGKFTKSDEEIRAQAQKAATEAAETAKRQVEASPHKDAPARFDDAAKAEWEKAPESIKGAIHRTIRELEQGHQKYKADSEAYERLRQFDEIAKGNGRDLKDSLAKVVEVEHALARNPIAGLDMILREIGPRKSDGSPITLMDVAAHLMNQSPDDRAMQQNSTIAGLQSEIASLKQQLSGIAPVVQQYQTSQDEKALSDWAADKPHFAQLRSEVTEYVKQGVSPDEAYQKAVTDFQEKARAFGFAPASSNGAHTPAPPLAQTQAAPLNEAGQKSIHGSPSAGSDPAKRKPSKTLDESIDRAFEMHG